MSSSRETFNDTRFGGWKSFLVLLIALVGFVGGSQLATYIQFDLGYKKPYFLFWIVHSSFIFATPVHVGVVSLMTRRSPMTYFHGIREAIGKRLGIDTSGIIFGSPRFLTTVAICTLCYNVPALLWYVAIALSRVGDVTAILNTNAFWTWLLSTWLFGDRLQTGRLLLVLLAILGVLLIVYGAGQDGTGEPSSTDFVFFGDLVALAASWGYAIAQVWFKARVALPNEPYEGFGSVDDRTGDARYSNDTAPLLPESRTDRESRSDTRTSLPVYPAFGLHPTFITSCVGLGTLLTFWPLIIILHYARIERFEPPETPSLWLPVSLAAVFGMLYNSAIYILVALWGPVTATVSSMLTIVLVLISDAIFGHAMQTTTLWSFLGVFAIVVAFALLVNQETNGRVPLSGS